MAVDMLSSMGLGFLAGAFVLVVILFAALYVYMAMAWMTLAKRLGCDYAWIAWIPLAQLVLVPVLAEKDWAWVFMFLVPIANLVFFIIWMWKIYERRNMHGALSLIYIAPIIPVVGGLASLANLILLGVMAWKKD